MKTRSLCLTGLVLVTLTCIVSPSFAATRYISDRLVVSLRERPQDNATVMSYLKSDDALEVLENLGNYAKVRTAAGEVGYVQTQYLTDDTPKLETIQRLQEKSDRLATRVKELEDRAAMSTSQVELDRQRLAGELEESRDQAADLKKQLEQTRTELDQVNRGYQALRKNSENVLAISEERERLLQENRDLESRLAEIEKDRDALLKKGTIKWFLAGAGVLFLGWIIGKMSGSRRRSSLL